MWRRIRYAIVVAALIASVVRESRRAVPPVWALGSVIRGETLDVYGGYRMTNTPIAVGWIGVGVMGGIVPSTFIITPNLITCLPFPNPHTGHVLQMESATTATAAAGGQCAQAVYLGSEGSNNFKPTTRLYRDTTAFATDVSAISMTSVVDLDVTEGTLYWTCVWCNSQGATPNFLGILQNFVFPFLGFQNSNTQAPYTLYTRSLTFPTGTYDGTSFPDPLGAVNPARPANVPLMKVQYSS